jgi:hypothetical protein
MVERDLTVKRLMRNLRVLAGCDALLTSLSGGPLVTQILALTASTADAVAHDATELHAWHRRDPRKHQGGEG